MANPFGDLELLMDHNVKLSAASPTLTASQARPSIFSPTPGESRPYPPTDQDGELQHQTLTPSYHQPHPALASLSLAFGPGLSSYMHFNPGISKLPHATTSTTKFSSAALPSQKKCISPMPIMPAISATVGLGCSTASVHPLGSEKAHRARTAFPDYQRLPDRSDKSADPNNGAAMRRASIVWFRNDLRTHDHEALFTASKESLSVLPVYVFDPRDYGKSSSGFDKTGPYRAKFLMQSVENLRHKLKELGSDLVVRVGKPEEVLMSLAKSIGADALYVHQEVSYDELQAESKVSAALQEEGVDVKYFWGSTLFHMDDLPFKLEEMPTTYAGFRQKVQNIQIRTAMETPKQLKGLPIRGGIKAGDIPTLEELGVKSLSPQRQEHSTPSNASLVGGEFEALERLKTFAVDYAKQSSKLMNQSSNKAGVNSYNDSLNGSNFSCKISPWLALGCLSPRRMFGELQGGEKSGLPVSTAASVETNGNEQGLNSLVFELLWRDFFRFVTRKYAASRLGLESKAQRNVAISG